MDANLYEMTCAQCGEYTCTGCGLKKKPDIRSTETDREEDQIWASIFIRP